MEKYQAIILAAGVGSRMGPLTKHKPKTLLKVNGEPLITKIINTLEKKYFSEIIVVIGHEGNKIKKLLNKKNKKFPIRFISNSIYKKTNSTYSMWLTIPHLKNNIIIINADTIFDKKIMQLITKSKYKNGLAIDDNIKIPLPREAMKVTIKKNIITNVSKIISSNKTNGDAIGIYKFDKFGMKLLIKNLNNLVKKNDTKHLFTLAVKKLLNKINIYSISTEKRKWIEIDNKRDLKNARKLFA